MFQLMLLNTFTFSVTIKVVLEYTFHLVVLCLLNSTKKLHYLTLVHLLFLKLCFPTHLHWPNRCESAENKISNSWLNDIS